MNTGGTARTPWPPERRIFGSSAASEQLGKEAGSGAFGPGMAGAAFAARYAGEDLVDVLAAAGPGGLAAGLVALLGTWRVSATGPDQLCGTDLT